MAVKIKLKRMGKIHAPFYRIIVADARTKRDGRAIEEIGKYHPKNEPSFIEVDSERAQHWLSVGAQPTDPVRKILEITGDWQKFKGLPGAEGTLRTAAPKPDKKDAYAAAVSEAVGTGDTGKGKGRKPGAKADGDQADADGAKAGSGRSAGRSGGRQAAAKAPRLMRPRLTPRRLTRPRLTPRRLTRPQADTATADTAAADSAPADAVEDEKPAKASTAKASTEKASTEKASTGKASAEKASTARPALRRPARTRPARTRPARTRPARRRPARRRRPYPPMPSQWRSRVTEPDMLEEALEHLVKGIVENPDDVRVDSHGLRRGRVLEVRVHPEDLGKVIGRGGRTAKALRTVIGSLAGGKYVRVDLLDVDEVR